jgi:UDP-glucuronate 4-epimerase
MNVLVTGGAGLIGMAARDALVARGHKVIAIDITDYGRGDKGLTLVRLDLREPLEALIDAEGIEAIVHAGAISGPMLAKGQPLFLVSANIDGTAMLLDLARVRGMRRFVFCSSISVYGSVGKDLIAEERPLHPTSVYGATKVACEQLIEGFAAEFGLSGVSLRIGRVYGPYRRANCHLGSIIRDANAGRVTEIGCTPDFPFHYVYVDDVADAIAAALEAGRIPSSAYNVGGGLALPMPEIAAIARRTIPNADIRLVEGEDDVPDVQTAFDLSRIRSELGWAPTRDIARGLSAYAAAIDAGRAA